MSARSRVVVLFVLAACRRDSGREVTLPPGVEPPRWHFDRVEHGQGSLTLTSVWARSDGVVFAVGWAGTVITNRSPPGEERRWSRMASGTTENLTSIAGLENGADFGLPSADGEMFAVGWHGTLLHYHPNPDGDPATDDGVWRAVAAPGGPRLATRMRVDPACPDYDGDGFGDDGDGDGFWGNALCSARPPSACDDNCRTAANGSERPLVDGDRDGCLGPSGQDAPAAASIWQLDADGDGIGDVCDAEDASPGSPTSFTAALFSVAVRREADGSLVVLAVGEAGGLVSYHGPSAATAVVPPARAITDAAAWLAQLGLPFRYDNDCPAGTPAGSTCNNGRLPPACPAQCHPRRTSCSCPVGQGQCCDAAAPTGAGCGDGSCGAAANACVAGTCRTFCPGCFRRLEHTLRGVALSGDQALVVGARGTIIVGSAARPAEPWSAPTCTTLPHPLDDAPLLTAVAAGNGAFRAIGAGGAVVRYPAGGCAFQTLDPGTAGFLSGAQTSGGTTYVVGDRGTLVMIGGAGVEALDPGVEDNLFAVSVGLDERGERLWIVGAGGVVVTGAYY